LAKEGMADRVIHRAGNALTEDLGTEVYDLVFMAAVVHHFDDRTNREGVWSNEALQPTAAPGAIEAGGGPTGLAAPARRLPAQALKRIGPH
jgi:hypothetical protein